MKKFYYLLLYYAGLFHLWHFLNRKKITILVVHGVMDENHAGSWLPLRQRLSVSDFETSISLLVKYYNFVSIDEAIQMLNGEAPVTNNSLCITFDDGCRNNLTYALPIMQKHQIKPVFYVATDYTSNNKPFWFDRLDYALQNTSLKKLTYSIADKALELNLASRSDIILSYGKLRIALKSLDSDAEMHRHIGLLCDILEEDSDKTISHLMKNDDQWVGFIHWDELDTISEAGQVDIGSHTVNHTRLACIDTEDIRHELLESKRDIETNTKFTCKHLCYPNGSYNAETIQLAQDIGYLSGVTTISGLNKPGDDLFQLKRIHLPVIKSTEKYTLLATCYLLQSINKFVKILRG